MTKGFEKKIIIGLSALRCYSKMLKMAIQFKYFFLIKRQNSACNVRNFGGFLVGISSDDVPALKVHVCTSDGTS